MIKLLTGLVRRTRQHHAIEHAALQLLAARAPNRRMLGISDPVGFTIVAQVQQAHVQRAVSDAMLRLQAGEAHLAIHPHCGTNLATTGLLAALAATLARAGSRTAQARNPAETFIRTTLFVLPALVVSQPLGMALQQYTTLADINDRWLVGVRTLRLGPLAIHRVVLE